MKYLWNLLAGAGILVWVFAIFAIVFCGAILWPYTLNSWLEYAGKPQVVVWWQGLLLGFFPVTAPFTVPAAIVTWIAMLFLGG